MKNKIDENQTIDQYFTEKYGEDWRNHSSLVVTDDDASLFRIPKEYFEAIENDKPWTKESFNKAQSEITGLSIGDLRIII